MTLLSIEGIAKEYYVRGRKVLALDSIDLTVAEGEFVTIVGPSGCGKSTLLNLIVGLLHSSSGRIVFRGDPINGICTKIGYVTQKDNLLPWRTLLQNVEIALEIRKIEKIARRNRAQELIKRVGLSGFEDHYPHELSGGMRQRANIIRTLIYDPELILMDEPFGPLDAQTRIVLQDQLLKLWSASRKTILFRARAPGFLGAEFRKVDRSLLGLEPVAGFCVSVRGDYRRIYFRPSRDHTLRNLQRIFYWRHQRYWLGLSSRPQRNPGADFRSVRRGL